MYEQFLHIVIWHIHIGLHCQHVKQLLVQIYLSEQTLLHSHSLTKAKSVALFLFQANFFFSVMSPGVSTECARVFMLPKPN